MALSDLPNPKWDLAGQQPICKEDFIFIERAILEAGGGGGNNIPLVWEDAGTVRIEATPDCPAAIQLDGLPNTYNPAVQVDGGLSDGKVRTITSNISLSMATGIYGSEKSSQWYAVMAIADDSDLDFTIKGMPIMRVKSQAGKVISLGTLTTPATGIGYGFVTDEMAGDSDRQGMVYFLTGASRGLMRPIEANNDDDSTGGTVTYSGDTLSIIAGDWFIILPPTNFRLVGTIFNNVSGDIIRFRRLGNEVVWIGAVAFTTYPGAAYIIVEDIRIACPFAISIRTNQIGDSVIGHPDSYNTGSMPVGGCAKMFPGTGITTAMQSLLEFCRYLSSSMDEVDGSCFGYGYPPGCGY